MVYKVDLNSNDYFSTSNANTTANRTYGIDWSFLNQDKKYFMTYNFLSKHFGTNIYPPIGLTSNLTNLQNQPYGNGNYTATASSVAGATQPFQAFDKTANYWRSGSAYDTSTGNYTGSTSTQTTSQGSILGEWLQIQLPNPIILDRFFISTRSVNSVKPRAIKILGSNNPAIPWSILYETNDLGLGNEGKLVNIETIPSQPFNYYRMVILRGSGSNTNYVETRELFLYDYNNPFSSTLLNINLGSFPQNVKASNLTQAQYTFLAGILRVKNKYQYAKAQHHKPIFLRSIPTSSFITINLLDFDGKTPITTNDSYLLTLFFEEVE